jgi:uncharacterized protein YbaP (TraB family)
MKLFRLAAALVLVPMGAFAQCAGSNLIDALSPEARHDLTIATDAQPFARGNLWQATKGETTVTIIGTYHIDDPRHDATLNRISPMLQTATTLLVEAGPEEESALKKAVIRDPGLMLITEGPSLLEQLTPTEWDELSTAMTARSIPPFMVAKFKPWYVSVMLGMPPCAIDAVKLENGLDKRIIEFARERELPVKALEPYDTVFKMFGQMTAEDQINMIRSTLIFEDQTEDFSFTLAEAYFAEDSRTMWEFMRKISATVPGYTPEKAKAEFDRMEEVLMTARNRAWIPVIEQAAGNGPVFVAFGALHLSGEAGVLNLLQQNGWTVKRLPLS